MPQFKKKIHIDQNFYSIVYRHMKFKHVFRGVLYVAVQLRNKKKGEKQKKGFVVFIKANLYFDIPILKAIFLNAKFILLKDRKQESFFSVIHFLRL